MHMHTLLILLLPSLALAAGKRGLGWPWDNTNNPGVFGSGTGRVSWIYNWELWKPGGVPANMKFISMARTADAGPNIAGYMADTGSKVLLCLNEPDMANQANLNVADAVAFYKKYCEPMRSKGVKVIAPGVTNGGGQTGLTYLSNFLKQCTGCKIDGINLHWYGADASQFKTHIRSAMSKFPDYPIWVTEFALDGPNYTTQLKVPFLKEAIKFLDSTKQVAFYAVFGAFEGTGGMLTDDGKLNTFGKTYKTYSA